MIAVLPDAPVAAGHVPAVLAVLLQVRRHILAGPPPALELRAKLAKLAKFAKFANFAIIKFARSSLPLR